jgi:hypothetical protein
VNNSIQKSDNNIYGNDIMIQQPVGSIDLTCSLGILLPYNRYINISTHTHADSVNGIDPNGKSLAGVTISIGIGGAIGAGVGYYRNGMKGAVVGFFAGAAEGIAVLYSLPFLLQLLPATSAKAFIATTASGTFAEFIEGLIYGTLLDDNGFQFDPLNGLQEGLWGN